MGQFQLKLSVSVFVLLSGGFTIGFVASSDINWDFLTSKVLLDQPAIESDFDRQLLSVLKDEVQEMRKDLTASFIGEHSRRKRSTEDYVNEAHLGSIEDVFGQGVNFTFQTDDVGSTTTVFQDELYIFQKDGIYKIKGLDVARTYSDVESETNATSYSNDTRVVHSIQKVFVSRWGLVEDTHVVATVEKDNVLFILVEEFNEGYSFLFTYAPMGPGLVLRQRIRNSGKVSAAKFFIFYDHLYLIVASDNEVHSLTSCPIFKWVGTYLDVIHTIQTRGASSVDTVVIEGQQYIAIAQSIDAAGNTEIGTQIVRMNRLGDLEKVQLLYSNQPVQLHFTKVYHEYILIVAQKQESAIIYFYGGYDFIHLQVLPSLKGNQVRITSILGPDSETYILASTGSEITIFVRATTNSPLTALMFAPSANNTYSVATTDHTNTITGITAKTPQYKNDEKPDVIFLAITWESHGKNDDKKENFVELYTLVFQKIPKVSDSYKQPEDKLSQCLLKLQQTLEASEPYVEQLQRSNATILRKSGNMRFQGTLNSQTLITVETLPGTSDEHLMVKPQLNREDKSKMSPTQLQSKILENIAKLEGTIYPKLKNAFIRDEVNTLNGEVTFVNGVKVQKLNTEKVHLSYLNGIPWQELRLNALRTNTSRLQLVTGNWSVEGISSDEVRTVPTIGGIAIDDILLTYTEPHQTQIVHTKYKFVKDVEFQAGLHIPQTEKINDIEINDIVNTTKPSANYGHGFAEVTGTKTANVITTGNGTQIRLVNKVNLINWYDSVLKTTGPPQKVNGVLRFNGPFEGQSVQTKLLNGKDWDAFLNNALVDGKDQLILYNIENQDLSVDSLVVDEINGVKIRDLLNKYDKQNVSTNIILDKLTVHGNIYNERLNGISNITGDNVVYATEDAHIYTPIDFHNLSVNYIDLDDDALISGVDVMKIAETGKTVTYIYTPNSNDSPDTPFTLDGKILATDAHVSTVNGISVPNYLSNAMKVSGENRLSAHQTFHNIPITVQGDFIADYINREAFENYVKIDGSDASNGTSSEEFINVPLHFANAMVHGKIRFGPGVTLNNIDISEYARNIVHRNDSGIVHGVKKFTQEIRAYNGIHADRINHYNLNHDVVMLRNGKDFYDIPHINFTDVEAAYLVSEGPITGGKSQGGLNLTEVEETTVYINKPATILSSVEFLSSIEAAELVVGGRLNNYSVADILERHIPLDSGNHTQYIHLNAIVEENMDFLTPVQIASINGVNPEQYFSVLVNRSQDAFINDRKIFKSEVRTDRNLYCKNGTINDIHLHQLESQAISRTKNQTITGNMVLNRMEAVNTVTSSLCGILVTDFVRIDKSNSVPEEVNSNVYFTTTEGTEIGGFVDVLKDVNGHNIMEVVESLTKLKGTRNFHTFTCKGDLTWNQPRTSGKGFSYLFNEAVRLQGDQVISGSVQFLKGFQAKHIKSYPWLNDVDLRQIELDGVFDGTNVTFLGKNTLPELNIGSSGSLEPLQSFSTNFVNGISLKKLNEAVVRRNGTHVIHGTKTLMHGASVESLISNDINGCDVDNIAKVNDDRVIDTASFDSLDGITDLQFTNLIGFQWQEFLNSRVTLDSSQVIQGQWIFSGNVHVDNFTANQVNDLQLEDAIWKTSVLPQVIRGAKTLGGVIINGDIKANSINGYQIDEIFPRILQKNKPLTFNQTVYFEGPVAIKNDMNIEDNVNDQYFMERLRHEFDAELEVVMKKSNSPIDEQNKSEALLQYLDQELGKAAVWLDYLTVGQYLKKELWRTDRVEVATLENEVRVGFSKLFSVSENQCGLPKGCLGNAVDFIEFGVKKYEQFDQITCKNVYDLRSELSGRGYTLVSHAVSYNQTCSASSDGATEVFEMKVGHNIGKKLIGSTTTGFITDAKTFHSNGIDYIVIAQFYDKNKGNHQTEIFVYAVENDTLVLVQSIPATGTLKIAVELLNETWFLAVANSLSRVPTTKINKLYGFDYDDHNDKHKEYSRGTLSEIYVWMNSQTEGTSGQFKLLREVVTERIVDVEFFQVQHSSHHQTKVTVDGFIAFAHSGNIIEIYKWDEKFMNFIIMQTIVVGDEYRTTSIHGLEIKDSTYLLVSLMPQGVLIYEYRCLEGFKLYLEVPILGVQDLNSFSVNQKTLLAVASSSLAFIAEAKIQGPLFL